MSKTSKYLFHGTNIYCLSSIISDNRIDKGSFWGKKNEIDGVRTSLNYDISKNFIVYSMHWGEGGVLIFDYNKLEKDFKLSPYKDTYYGGDEMKDEQEIVVEADFIRNLDKYLVSINCDEDVITWGMADENINDSINDCGWCYGVDEKSIEQAKKNLIKLSENKKLNLLSDKYPNFINNEEEFKKSPSLSFKN